MSGFKRETNCNKFPPSSGKTGGSLKLLRTETDARSKNKNKTLHEEVKSSANNKVLLQASEKLVHYRTSFRIIKSDFKP